MNTAVCKAGQGSTRDIAERVSQKLFEANRYAMGIRQKLYGPVPENERSDEKDQPNCIDAFLRQIEIATDKIGMTLAEIDKRL